MSSLKRGHGNLLCIISVLLYELPKHTLWVPPYYSGNEEDLEEATSTPYLFINPAFATHNLIYGPCYVKCRTSKEIKFFFSIQWSKYNPHYWSMCFWKASAQSLCLDSSLLPNHMQKHSIYIVNTFLTCHSDARFWERDTCLSFEEDIIFTSWGT